MPRSFTPVAWSRYTNLYEVNVRQYTPEGTFEAFSRHLPRLREMGVETLWFMPVTPISVEGRQGSLGSYYACSDYTATSPEFGTIDDFRILTEQAHALGMKVIIDWVANHTGHDHIWTKTNPGFYKRNAEGRFYDNHGWADVYDLNYYDAAMRRAMIEAMQFWVRECNIDGFRCDMAHLVPLDFWKQARPELDKIKPLFWLAETEDYHYLEVFDCCYAWRWMHQTLRFCKGEADISSLKNLLDTYVKEFPADTYQLFFTANHDENSWNGTEYEKYGPAARNLAVFSCLWDGLPLIYSGQELPNTKRLKFFDKDIIEWKDKPQLHTFYQRLLKLRASHPAIVAAHESRPVFIPTSNDQYVLAFMRQQGSRELIVLLNLSPNQLFIQLPDGYAHGTYREIFTDVKIEVVPRLSLELKAWDCMVLEK
jgi:alpha-amylase